MAHASLKVDKDLKERIQQRQRTETQPQPTVIREQVDLSPVMDRLDAIEVALTEIIGLLRSRVDLDSKEDRLMDLLIKKMAK